MEKIDEQRRMIKLGDKLTIDGVYRNVPNPDRRWWQFWKPRKIAGGPQTFVVTGSSAGEMIVDNEDKLSLTERVARIEQMCGLGECETDHAIERLRGVVGQTDYREEQAYRNRVASAMLDQTRPNTAFEELFQRIQHATDRIYRQAGKLENIGERILGPVPQEAGKTTGEDRNASGTLEQALCGLNWLDGALSRLEAAADRLENI